MSRPTLNFDEVSREDGCENAKETLRRVNKKKREGREIERVIEMEIGGWQEVGKTKKNEGFGKENEIQINKERRD